MEPNRYDAHCRLLSSRAKQLSSSISRISFRDANSQNWELYLKQISLVNSQLQMLAEQLYLSSSSELDIKRFVLSFVFLPLTEAFPVTDCLPARFDPQISSRDVNNSLEEVPHDLFRFDEECKFLANINGRSKDMEMKLEEGNRLRARSVDDGVAQNICSAYFNGKL